VLAPASTRSTGSVRPGMFARIGDAARRAAPDWLEAVAGSLLWALLMGAAAWLSFLFDGWRDLDRVMFAAAFFAAGGLIAFAPAIWLGRFLSRGRADAGFAATFLALAVITISVTAALVSQQYRLYYAQWHDQTFTVRWFFQFAFTTAGAIYQFLVLGLRAYIPIAFVALIAASWWNAGRVR